MQRHGLWNGHGQSVQEAYGRGLPWSPPAVYFAPGDYENHDALISIAEGRSPSGTAVTPNTSNAPR
jgi:hypothetical protein